jgi:hypothetical protein
MRFRLRYSIRDLLWLTALLAMACAWWADHHSLADNWIDVPDIRPGTTPAIPGKYIDQWKAHLADVLPDDDPPPPVKSINVGDKSQAANRPAIQP